MESVDAATLRFAQFVRRGGREFAIKSVPHRRDG
jgi:hypothetical protein